MKGLPNTRPALYALHFPALLQIAINHGYVLAIHGSLQRDFDLIAVPWEEICKSEIEMIRKMSEYVGGNMSSMGTIKPHGRTAYIIHLGDNFYIDISVMPTI